MIRYHVGFLPLDRVHDPELDALALDYLEAGTPLGHLTRPEMGDDSPRGRGEGRLVQRKIWPFVYEYYFIPSTREVRK